jgi:hypothetical protein
MRSNAADVREKRRSSLERGLGIIARFHTKGTALNFMKKRKRAAPKRRP